MTDITELLRKQEPFNFGTVKGRWRLTNKGQTAYGVWVGIKSIEEKYSLLQAVYVKTLNRWFACVGHNLSLPAEAEVIIVSLSWLPEIYKGGARAAAKLRMGVR